MSAAFNRGIALLSKIKTNYSGIIGWMAFIFCLFPFAIAYGEDLMLSWDHNTQDELAGYYVYYGTSSRNYFEDPFQLPKENVVEIEGRVSYQLPVGLTPGITYYFAVTAYDMWDYETDFSNEDMNLSSEDEPDIIPTTTTTAPIPFIPHCRVIILSPSAIVKSGEEIELTAVTTCDSDEVEGKYQWEVESTVGSSIDGNMGLYTVGDTTADSDVIDTIKVIDSIHEVTSNVEVTVQPHAPAICDIILTPSISTIGSGKKVSFNASIDGERCEDPVFTWSINTDFEVNSYIDPNGENCLYTAGNNETGMLLDDIISVSDSSNETSKDITVSVLYGRILHVFPKTLFVSRWLPLIQLVITVGEGTAFDRSSYTTFMPDDSITTIGQIGLGNLMGVLLLISSRPEEGSIDLTVTTINDADQTVVFPLDDAFNINLLPPMFDENENNP